MSYPAKVIAYALVKKAIEEGNPVTQMKLQKMLYFAHGVHLVMHENTPLVKETFQAWKYGPVIPDIYQAYKFYGSRPITDTFLVALWNTENYEQEIANLDEATKNTIKLTWENTSKLDAIQLSNWTHAKGSPWSNHYKEGISDSVIPNDEIYAYFHQFLAPAQ